MLSFVSLFQWKTFSLKKPFYIHHLIRLKIINISYRLNAGLGERTNGSGLKDSSGGSDRISNGCGEGGSGDGDGFRSKKK